MKLDSGRADGVSLRRPATGILPSTWEDHSVDAFEQVRLVLFDLDGTLVDHDGTAASAVEHWLVGEGWLEPGGAAASVALWDEVAERHYPACQARETTFQGQRRRRLREFLPYVGIDPSDWSERRLDATFEGYLAAYEDAWRPYPDALACLLALGRRVRVAVLSNGDQAQQEDKLRRTGLWDHVASVLTSDLLGVSKPDPAIFARACERLDVRPDGVVYVGDRLDLDARAATAAGLHGIWLNRTGAQAADDVDTIVDLRELTGAISLAE
ncbi:HAD family hydrolase [Pengzhenrongella sp.]|uniref:HAD family hydrolase n=1 Tax=Pengzhenrongella sp. TaxID=2888820 RepID=UPI002F92708A